MNEGKAIGGFARAEALSPDERKRIASNAAKARWDRYRERLSDQGYNASDVARAQALCTLASKLRDFPHNTCGASRDVQAMAEALLKDGRYPMLYSNPAHCAEALFAVVAELYRARSTIRRINGITSDK